MIIDSHQHFWNYDPIKDAWIDASMKVIRRDFLPKDLKPLLEKNGIDGCIARKIIIVFIIFNRGEMNRAVSR
jgi:L-fuconolactonase